MTSTSPKKRYLAGIVLVLGALVLGALMLRALGPDAEQAPPRAQTERAALRGRVLTDEGRPLAGATVEAGTQRATSDAQGRFALARREADATTLDLTHPKYVRGGVGTLGAVPLAAHDQSAELELVMHRPARLAGRVTLEGQPVVGADIGLVYTGARGLRGEELPPHTFSNLTQTHARGHFELPRVAAGELTISVETALTDVPYAESQTLTLSPGESVTDLQIELRPITGLRGGVRTDQGDPLVAELTLVGPGGSRQGRSQSDGSFRFEGLEPGAYTLSASARGHFPDTVGPFDVEARAMADQEVVLERGQGLFGRVLNPEGQPQSGFVIATYARDSRSLQADRNGVFMWPDAPDETFTLRATASQYTASFEKRARLGQAVVLELRPGGEFSGTVLGPRGRPLTSYTIAIAEMEVPPPHPFNARNIAPVEVNDAAGRFTIGPLAPGFYTLKASAPGLASATSELLEVRIGRTTPRVNLQLHEGASVAGVVRDAITDAPVPAAELLLLESSTVLAPRSTIANPSGRFALAELPPGRVTLRVRARGYGTELVAGLELESGEELIHDIVLTPTDELEPALAFYGIGTSLHRERRHIIISSVMPGSSAEEAGLMPGDRITSVDGRSTQRLSLNQVIELIRGQEGTPITLGISRLGEGDFVVGIARRRVQVLH
ncbi:PDZ domain-containing protein [Lujinxingia sediminis]|uniref:PDZ domain-containing protein n=1 Tax=Lujinxingia sediminis TaxID=2480984 RepID=A0ABY0CPB7_9DELT|nr:carboxypeptidase regulatory-like domain-containing protein [Lujinxingia sediminis]RVU41542.1 PDZ domain-containing protein [Lujinxingia sediminis]